MLSKQALTCQPLSRGLHLLLLLPSRSHSLCLSSDQRKHPEMWRGMLTAALQGLLLLFSLPFWIFGNLTICLERKKYQCKCKTFAFVIWLKKKAGLIWIQSLLNKVSQIKSYQLLSWFICVFFLIFMDLFLTSRSCHTSVLLLES